MVNSTTLRNKIRKIIDDYGSTITINRIDFETDEYGDRTSDNLLESCDSITNYLATYSETPTIDKNEKVEGTGSLNCGTTVTTQSYFGYSNQSLTEFDGTDKIFYVYIYIDDLDRLRTSACVYFYLGNGVIQGTVQDPQKYVYFDKSELVEGWNRLSFDVSNEGTNSSGTLDVTAITSYRINFYKTNTTDTVALGSFKIDYLHYEQPTTTVGITYDFIAGRLNQVPAGSLTEGDLTILIKDNEDIPLIVGDNFPLEFPITFGNKAYYKLTYKSVDYDVLSIKRFKLQEEILAKEIKLKRRI